MPLLPPWYLAAAWLLDALFGDPPNLARFHPIVWIGKLIALLEKPLNRENASPASLMARGVVLWLVVVGTAFVSTLAAFLFLARVSPLSGILFSVVAAFTAVSTGDLARQVLGVVKEVSAGNLPGAREKLSMIVGRDTENLSEPEICRAAFETAAENTSDGIVGPLFYLSVGAAFGLGPALGMAYKAVNTLDSMVGYKNSRYIYFGKFSAKMDDFANLLPARITALLIALLAALFYRRGLKTIKTVMRDAKNHSSPNSGLPEAAYAGALGVRIGGTNYYGGVPRESHTIGTPEKPLDTGAVRSAVRLLWWVSALSAALGTAFLHFI